MSDGDVSSELNEQEGAQSEQASKVNKDRRYFLIGATSAVAGVGAVGAAVPFVQFWNPSARARAAGAPVKIDFSKLPAGIYIVRMTFKDQEGEQTFKVFKK